MSESKEIVKSTLYLEKSIHERLQVAKVLKRTTMKDLVEKIVVDYLDKNDIRPIKKH